MSACVGRTLAAEALLLVDRWSAEELARLKAKAAAMRSGQWSTMTRDADAAWRDRNRAILNAALEKGVQCR